MDKKIDRSSFPSFWISPEVNLFDAPIHKIISKTKHKRCNSGKVSPYQDQSCLLKLQSALKTITRKHSPSNSIKLKKFPNKSTSFKMPKSTPQPQKTKKKKVGKSSKKKLKNNEVKLKVLNKDNCKKAPKIFNNQIFCDIYDREGNHDRVMETFEVSETKTRIYEDSVGFDGKFIIASNLETEFKDPEIKIFKQPENSFMADTEKNIKGHQLELFEKLNNLAAQRDYEDDY